MAVDYNDERFTEVKNDEKTALDELNETYDGMIKESDKHTNDQINAAKQWEQTQKKNQQAQTDFAIEQIKQQKDQAKTDYIKEQSGAYVDWQKQSNEYGANAEKMAASGLTNSGYSESSQVSMYNAYQSRITAARESFTRAVLNYDNAIKDARLQNNALLAEIAYESLRQQLELSLQGFQYKNTLILQKAQEKRAISSEYHDRWLAVLNQINTENALAEEKRQFDAQIKLEQEKFDWQKAQAAKSSSGSSGGRVRKSSGSSGSSSKGAAAIKKSVDQYISDKKAGKKTSSSDLAVDMGSVLALGYGPISAERLDDLVSSGQVVEYEQDGKLKYRNNVKLMSAGGSF